MLEEEFWRSLDPTPPDLIFNYEYLIGRWRIFSSTWKKDLNAGYTFKKMRQRMHRRLLKFTAQINRSKIDD